MTKSRFGVVLLALATAAWTSAAPGRLDDDDDDDDAGVAEAGADDAGTEEDAGPSPKEEDDAGMEPDAGEIEDAGQEEDGSTANASIPTRAAAPAAPARRI